MTKMQDELNKEGLEAAARKHYEMTGMTLSNPSMEYIIRAYLNASNDKQGWKPIEEAPKDGTAILVLNTSEADCGYCTEPNQIGVAHWVYGLGDKYKWFSTVCCDGVSNFIPVKWQPLPPTNEKV